MLKNVDIFTMLQLVMCAIPQFLQYVIPFATLSSSSMVLGDLGANNELLALRSLGIPMKKVYKVLVILSLILTVITFFISDYLMPQSQKVYKSLLNEIMQELPTFELNSNSTNTVGDIVLVNKDVDGNIIAVPNDIEIAQGGTVWNIVTQLRDILPRYETFFDVDGVFIYQPIPTGSGDPVIIDDTIWPNLLIDESINNDFESVKNYIEVYGRTLDPSYFSTNTVYSGSTLSLTVADYPTNLTDNTIVGFTTPSTGDISATSAISLKMNSLASSLLHEYGTNNLVTHLDNDTYYVAYYNQGWYLMGHQQPVGIAYDDNPDSPFYVNGSIGRIRHVLYGGEYENITSDKMALERAKYELWKSTRLQDSITLTSIPNPWLDVNVLISHAIRGKSQENVAQYIIKSISTDYGIEGTQSINAITYYPLYPDI